MTAPERLTPREQRAIDQAEDEQHGRDDRDVDGQLADDQAERDCGPGRWS